MGPTFNETGYWVANSLLDRGYLGRNVCHVADMKSLVTDIGVFFAHGHGGYGVLRDKSTEYAVWTCDVVSDSTNSYFIDSEATAMEITVYSVVITTVLVVIGVAVFATYWSGALDSRRAMTSASAGTRGRAMSWRSSTSTMPTRRG